MRSTVNRELDIIIFGASGYVGQYVVEELAQSAASVDIKWAVAGRNKEKLKESLETVQEYLRKGIYIGNIPIIEAEVQNALSVSNMCKRTKLVLNCVGPYSQYGEPVVKACVENGTHYVDLSAETKYLEQIQIKYFKVAREKKVFVVGACGFGFLFLDYAIAVLKKRFPGDLNSVEYYYSCSEGERKDFKGPALNIGTLLSAAETFWDTIFVKDADKTLKESLYEKDLPQVKYSLPWRLPIFYCSEEKCWNLYFMDSGIELQERHFKRSQLYRYNYLNDRPILSRGHIKIPSVFTGLLILLYMICFGIMSIFSFSRNMLAKYPSFFTGGIFTAAGPTREQIMGVVTTLVLYGKGWKEKLSDFTDQHVSKPDLKMKLTLQGPEPAYPLTAMCMVQAGLTILEEHDKMPLQGGVHTPGVAFENTALQQRLEKRGMVFKFENIN